MRIRALLAAGLVSLGERRDQINALNAAATAEAAGDTADNMMMTVQAVLSELDRLADASERRTIDEIGRDEIVASVARAALLGARGSSGVILSQLIRGAAEELASRPGELIDPALISAALARAVDQAYGSVREPAEGTILTVARELAHRVASELAHRSNARLAADATAAEQDFLVADVIQGALAVDHEPAGSADEPFAALRAAALTDAGGFGLTVMLAGMVAALRGDEPAPAPAQPRIGSAGSHPRHASITYRYCTNFAVTGDALAARRFVATLERIGDAVLIVGDARTLRVHVHTDDPAAAQAVFADAGEVSHVEIVDMRSDEGR